MIIRKRIKGYNFTNLLAASMAQFEIHRILTGDLEEVGYRLSSSDNNLQAHDQLDQTWIQQVNSYFLPKLAQYNSYQQPWLPQKVLSKWRKSCVDESEAKALSSIYRWKKTCIVLNEREKESLGCRERKCETDKNKENLHQFLCELKVYI